MDKADQRDFADRRDFDSHYEYWDKIIWDGIKGGEMKEDKWEKQVYAYKQGLADATKAAMERNIQNREVAYQLTHKGFFSLIKELMHLNRRASQEIRFVVRLPIKWFK